MGSQYKIAFNFYQLNRNFCVWKNIETFNCNMTFSLINDGRAK